MAAPLVSIIVPIYKVEPYLRQCVDSVVNQTYTNLEIILVDDGSPDHCPQICDEYAVKDNRIIVIHKENGGLSDARNAGLDIANGDYIYFLDSDDIIPTNCISALFEIISKEDAEIASSSFDDFFNEEPTSQNSGQSIPYTAMNASEALVLLCKYKTRGLMSSCMKIYKRNCFDGIRFPKGKLYEDARINYKIYYNCKKICYTSIPLYYYRNREGSIMANTKGLIFDLDAREERYAFLAKHKEPAAQYCLESLCWDYLIISIQPQNFFETSNLQTTSEEALSKFKKYTSLFLKTDKGSIVHRVLLRIFLLFPGLYSFLYKISPWHIRKAI